MKDKFTGDVAHRLMQSYQSDSKPYITNSTINFREQDCGYEELIRLNQLFFPNYWNCGWITSTKKIKALTAKIDELGQVFFHGILPNFNRILILNLKFSNYFIKMN